MYAFEDKKVFPLVFVINHHHRIGWLIDNIILIILLVGLSALLLTNNKRSITFEYTLVQ